MRRSPAPFSPLKLAVLSCLSLPLASCAGAVESSRTEDAARRAVPVAICLKPLPRHGKQGVSQSLTPDDYWSIVLPSYDHDGRAVDRSAPDCAGRPILQSPDLLQAEGPRTGPIRVTEADAVVTPGADNLKVVWLRTHKLSDGTSAGPIALLRPKDDYAEVYGIGLYRGRPDKARFGLERMGSDFVVSATSDGCTGAATTASCETTLTALLLTGGQLVPAATLPLDRVEHAAGANMGVAGTVQYKLTATPVFEDKGIRVVEQVVVRDAAQQELRKSEQERWFVRKQRAKLVASADSLWSQVAQLSPSPAAPPPPPPPKSR